MGWICVRFSLYSVIAKKNALNHTKLFCLIKLSNTRNTFYLYIMERLHVEESQQPDLTSTTT